MNRRIDIHHHALSPDVVEVIRDHGLPTPGQQWEIQATLEMMAANEIEAAVVSNVVPCDVLGDTTQVRRLVRQVNEAAAEVVRNHPDRFGFLALLPLPYVDIALEEVRYAFDELGADGVVLLAHGGERYLGDKLFDPVFAELNRRKAVALVHPMDLPQGGTPSVSPVFADFLLDTTRAAINLITSGTLDRYPEVSMILSHAGGFLPYAASRVEVASEVLGMADQATVREGIRRFHYDLTLSAPAALPSLLAAAGSSQVLYGTDWSGVPASAVRQVTTALDEAEMDGPARQAIDRDNALRLLPRLAERINLAPAGTTR
jgi:predicted TIM-barrel fold metal-dependent hydrolase